MGTVGLEVEGTSEGVLELVFRCRYTCRCRGIGTLRDVRGRDGYDEECGLWLLLLAILNIMSVLF